MNNLRASVIELWSRLVPYDIYKNIYSNGENDQYSRDIEKAILNSPTASMAQPIFKRYVQGEGLTNDIDFDEFTSLYDIVKEIADNITKFGGAWIHRTIKISESGKFETGSLSVLDYHKCRIGKKDDAGFDSKIHYGTFSYKKGFFSNFKKADTRFYYSFSNNQNVILEQIKADNKDEKDTSLKNMLSNYRGQVMFVNTMKDFIYPLSPFDAAFNDMDTEYRIGLYTNKQFRSGFLGKLLMFFSGLNEDDSENLRKNVQKWLGAESSDNVYIQEVESVEAVKDSFHIEQLNSQYDDDIGIHAAERAERNILGLAAGLPAALVFTNDGSLFSGSGEQLIQLQKYYNLQTQEYRILIEKSLKRLGFDTKIITLGTAENEKENDNAKEG